MKMAEHVDMGSGESQGRILDRRGLRAEDETVHRRSRRSILSALSVRRSSLRAGQG